MPIEKFILHKRQFKRKRFTIENSPTIKNQKQFIMVPVLRIGVSFLGAANPCRKGNRFGVFVLQA
jgi:hypothetical protein